METSSEKSSTASAVIPWYNVILDHAENSMKSYSSIVKELQKSSPRENRMRPVASFGIGLETAENLRDASLNAFQKMDKYFNVSSDFCIASVILDPRHKMELYDDSEKLEDENINEMGRIRQQLNTMYLEYNTEPISQHEYEDSNPIFKKRKVSSSNELDIYLTQPTSAPHENPIRWWQYHQFEYPNLSRMARDYLAIPASSTSSERAFSSAKHLVTDTRTRLSS